MAAAIDTLRAASRPIVLIEVMTDYGQLLLNSSDRVRAVATLAEASALAQKIGANRGVTAYPACPPHRGRSATGVVPGPAGGRLGRGDRG